MLLEDTQTGASTIPLISRQRCTQTCGVLPQWQYRRKVFPHQPVHLIWGLHSANTRAPGAAEKLLHAICPRTNGCPQRTPVVSSECSRQVRTGCLAAPSRPVLAICEPQQHTVAVYNERMTQMLGRSKIVTMALTTSWKALHLPVRSCHACCSLRPDQVTEVVEQRRLDVWSKPPQTLCYNYCYTCSIN